jgi:hypothetical protein
MKKMDESKIAASREMERDLGRELDLLRNSFLEKIKTIVKNDKETLTAISADLSANILDENLLNMIAARLKAVKVEGKQIGEVIDQLKQGLTALYPHQSYQTVKREYLEN